MRAKLITNHAWRRRPRVCAGIACLLGLACSHGPKPENVSASDPVPAASGGATGASGVSATAGVVGGHDPGGAGQSAAGVAAVSGTAGTSAAGSGSGNAGHAASASAGMGAGAGGGSTPATAPALRVYGSTATLELAPVLLAAQSIYPGQATVSNGGIADLFSASNADAATNAETQALRQSVAHPNLRIIFTVCEGFYRIVGRRSAGISTLADLRGKKVATTSGTSSAYYLHKLLGSVNLTESDITLVALLAPSSAQSTLQSRQADAVTIWEPEIQHAIDALGTDAFEFQDRSIYRELFNLHTTSEKLSNPESRRGIVAFTKALIGASEQIRNRPEDVWPLVAKTTSYDQALISKVWNNEGFAGGLVSDLLDVLEAEEVWLAKTSNRAARTRAQLAMLIDDSVLRDALAP